MKLWHLFSVFYGLGSWVYLFFCNWKLALVINGITAGLMLSIS